MEILGEPLVSIPKGAIEADCKFLGVTNRTKFQYQKVRLKPPEGVRFAGGQEFQYQKVRLKLCYYDREQYKHHVSIPKGAIEAIRARNAYLHQQCFNTKRCD